MVLWASGRETDPPAVDGSGAENADAITVEAGANRGIGLSELLVKAREGEEVLITVRGRPEARLVPVRMHDDSADLKAWANELSERLATAEAAPASSSREIIDELRGRY